jgi:hypothetical protein
VAEKAAGVTDVFSFLDNSNITYLDRPGLCRGDGLSFFRKKER